MQNNEKNVNILMKDVFNNLRIEYEHEDSEGNMILDQEIDISEFRSRNIDKADSLISAYRIYAGIDLGKLFAGAQNFHSLDNLGIFNHNFITTSFLFLSFRLSMTISLPASKRFVNSFLRLTRVWNLLILALAQYFTAVFLVGPETFKDLRLFLLSLSTVMI